MPKKNDFDEDKDEDDDDETFDFLKIFSDPNKFVVPEQFQEIFRKLMDPKVLKPVFDTMMKNLPEEFKNLKPEDLRKEFMKNKSKFGFKGPFFSGFSMNFGPDGLKLEPFGNIKPKPFTGEPEFRDKREPLIEVNEGDDEIVVIAEMPGITKEDIVLKADNTSLNISTKGSIAGRNYEKDVELPSQVDSNYAKARYMNGILEVKLKKIKSQQKDIQID